MKIQQIRNATLKISYADKIFLIDPYLEEKNKFGCFADIPGKPFLTADNVKNHLQRLQHCTVKLSLCVMFAA